LCVFYEFVKTFIIYSHTGNTGKTKIVKKNITFMYTFRKLQCC